MRSYPLTPADWISPTIDELPDSWADRAYHIFNELADPALDATLTPDMVTGQSEYPVEELKRLIARGGGMTAPSYQMPAVWQFSAGQDTQLFRIPAFPRRIDRIAGPSRKIAIAGGAPRISGPFLRCPAPCLPTHRDIDPSAVTNPSLNLSCFTSGNMPMKNGFLQLPPVNPASDAYSADSPHGNETSYRHPGRTMNVLPWDGHVRTLTGPQSLDPSLWYPRGTEYLGGARPEVTEVYGVEVGDIIN